MLCSTETGIRKNAGKAAFASTISTVYTTVSLGEKINSAVVGNAFTPCRSLILLSQTGFGCIEVARPVILDRYSNC